jgi:hypothetical protein
MRLIEGVKKPKALDLHIGSQGLLRSVMSYFLLVYDTVGIVIVVISSVVLLAAWPASSSGGELFPV